MIKASSVLYYTFLDNKKKHKIRSYKNRMFIDNFAHILQFFSSYSFRFKIYYKQREIQHQLDTHFPIEKWCYISIREDRSKNKNINVKPIYYSLRSESKIKTIKFYSKKNNNNNIRTCTCYKKQRKLYSFLENTGSFNVLHLHIFSSRVMFSAFISNVAKRGPKKYIVRSPRKCIKHIV